MTQRIWFFKNVINIDLHITASFKWNLISGQKLLFHAEEFLIAPNSGVPVDFACGAFMFSGELMQQKLV